MTHFFQIISFRWVRSILYRVIIFLKNRSTKLQSDLRNYGIPLFVAISLYVVFHKSVDNFLLETSTQFLDEGLTLFFVFTAATTFIYLFGALIWLDSKRNHPKYQMHQKLSRYKYLIKTLIISNVLCLGWRLLQLLPFFNDSQTYFVEWCYFVIAIFLVTNIIILRNISCFCRKKDDNSNTANDKKELKADSVESAIVNIESSKDPEEPFIVARNGLKSVIDRVYSNSIANLGEGSYIIGVNGEWGSGKSTLIELVKRQMDGDVHIIDFNPWTSHQPTNLPIDFFRTIAASIGSFIMRRTIVRYGLALTKAAKKDIGDVIETLFGERSLDSQLKEIGEYIKRRNLKLLIIIDDIDRMDGDEILAVLKLARRSGNLPNTVYLLAFNHEYVEAQISQKIKGEKEDQSDSFNYIDKIVNLHFDVPKYTSDYFVGLLTKDIPAGITNEKEPENIELPDIVKEKISNFRAYKKIYNKVVVQYDSFKEHIFINDFIVLKTLQIYDSKLYNALMESIREARALMNIEKEPSNLLKRIDSRNRPAILEGKDVTSINDIICELLKIKYRPSESDLIAFDSLISYIKKEILNGFILKQLACSAIKIDENIIKKSKFDTLEFSHSNVETTIDKYLEAKGYPLKESLFVVDFITYSKVKNEETEKVINNHVYAIFLNYKAATLRTSELLESIIPEKLSIIINIAASYTNNSSLINLLGFAFYNYTKRFDDLKPAEIFFNVLEENPREEIRRLSAECVKDIEHFKNVILNPPLTPAERSVLAPL